MFPDHDIVNDLPYPYKSLHNTVCIIKVTMQTICMILTYCMILQDLLVRQI